MCEDTPRAEQWLPMSDEAPALARQFLRSASCATHHSAVVEDAVLLVSELVTNSLQHGGPPLVVAVDCDDETLQVRVRDGSSTRPTPRDAAHADERGRGLALVSTLSADWGVDPDADGKHVWFKLRYA
jgi:anti-sigma regulatory factor (Ser/Thr protein kinase)